jgi:SDR family mycofactocin-dependent oxidoreductase
MNSLEGQVAFITGAARGQGRSHAVLLAERGADIIAVDACAQVDSAPYPLASKADLEQTSKEVEALGRRIVARKADVRDPEGLAAAYQDGVDELGPARIVIANAGIAPMAVAEHPRAWQDAIDINLTGVFNTVETAVPSMITAGSGGSIVLISSTAGNNGVGGPSRGGLGYAAAKHGVVGLMRSYANNLAPHRIRVNSIHPTGTNTPMVANKAMEDFLAQEPERWQNIANALPVPLIEAIDISHAVEFLVSEAGRYVTGVLLPVDAGFSNKK